MQVLILEQKPHDGAQVGAALKTSGLFCLSGLEASLLESNAAIRLQEPDLVIVAANNADDALLEHLRTIARDHGDLAILVVCQEDSGFGDFDCVRAGAQDFILAETVPVQELERRMELAVIRKAHEAQKAQWLRQELSEAQAGLVEAEKMAALGNLVAGIAHEINTPVGIGITASSHLSSRLDEMREQFAQGRVSKSAFNDFLERTGTAARLILTNLERTARLVQGFKQIAVDQSGEDKRDFSLNDFLGDVVLHLNNQLEDSGHQAVFLPAAGETRMYSFPEHIRRVLTLLTSNAVIHGFLPGTSGTITIELQPIQPDRCCVRFTDDGAGIESRHLPHLFEPFYTTRRGENTGLGLNIVYNIVTQGLRGKIEVSSQIHKGTCFTVSLPLKIEDFPVHVPG